MKKIAVIIAAVIIAAAAYYFLRPKSGGVEYKTEVVARGDIVESVTATGTLNAVITVQVGTQASGTIKEIFADFNSPVKKGQLIARINPSAFEAQRDEARANLLGANAGLDKAAAALADAERTFARNNELFAKNLIARSEVDSAVAARDTARAMVGSAKSEIARSEAALKLAETNLMYASIISPVDGVVISRNVDVGQTVAASFQTPTLFTIAEDLTKMQIDTNVNEADIGNIKNGQGVDFTVDAYPETTFTGRVFQIRNAPIVVQNVVTYDVVIKVNNADLKLKPGMTTNASIITARRNNALRVPNSALRIKIDINKKKGDGKGGAEKGAVVKGADENGDGVWALLPTGPARVAITPGISDGSYTEVKEGGIKEGQNIIIEVVKSRKGNESGPPRMF